jgi:hypothetical protein
MLANREPLGSNQAQAPRQQPDHEYTIEALQGDREVSACSNAQKLAFQLGAFCSELLSGDYGKMPDAGPNSTSHRLLRCICLHPYGK